MRVRHRRLVALLSAGALALTMAACGSDDGGSNPDPVDNPSFEAGTTMAKLAEAGTIRVGIKYDQPLFGEESLDGGFEGFDVEIAKLLAAKLGIPADKIQFVEAVSANREPFLQQDKVDLVVATYTINETRDEVIDFAGPYYVAGQDIMVKKGNPLGIKGPDDLDGVKTCTVEGSTPAANMQDNYPDADLVLFDEYSKCKDALDNGQVDAVTTDNVILSGYVFSDPDKFELVGNPFTEEPYGIGVAQTDDKVFCEWVNDTLDTLEDDGDWATAFKATIGQVITDTPEPPATGSCTTPGAA
jgi:glutamate transport system substrate-binding protein